MVAVPDDLRNDALEAGAVCAVAFRASVWAWFRDAAARERFVSAAAERGCIVRTEPAARREELFVVAVIAQEQ